MFFTGDIVRLKSGGPVLTVESTVDDVRVRVVWFVAGNPSRDVFDIDVLERAEKTSADEAVKFLRGVF
jgi:uncharacterized protein YodC (DUF2158 family)